MTHIFISYSSKHRPLTEQLVALLCREGYSVWWDYDLESWGPYQKQIDAALEAASAVLVIWSSGAAASTYVLAEANKALNAGKLVNARAPEFPISALPSPYNALHIDTLDLAEPYRLLRSIRSVWTGKPHATAKPLHEHYQGAFGVSLFDPKRAPLDRDASNLGPSALLQARHEAVPYIDATGLAERMLTWCQDDTRATAGRLIHGPGGFGKTRLLIETARRLRAQDWLAGFLQPPRRPDDVQETRQREQALEQVFALGDEPGVLLVVDYAEARQPEVTALARMLGARTSGRPLRLVLLARGDGWWQDFYQQTENIEPLFRLPGKSPGDIWQLAPIPAGEARTDFFAKTADAFKPIMAAMARSGAFPAWNGRPPDRERLARLATERAFARPLAIQMETLLHLASASPAAAEHGVEALLSRVLGLEQAHWRKLLGAMDEDRKRDVGRGVAGVTAVQGVNGAASAERLLMADDFYKGVRTARVHVDPVRRDLARVYGGADGGIAQLEPDLIGEHHVAGVADVELIEGCLRWIEDEPEATRPQRRHALLRVLQRATQPEHGLEIVRRACDLLDHIVRTHAATLAADIIGVLRDTPGALLERLQSAVPALDESALAAVDDALPLESLMLMDVSLVVAQKRFDAARVMRSAADAGDTTADERETFLSHLAARARTLGVRYSNLNRPEDGLKASKEAVEIYRALTKDRPDVFRPDLARSLNHLGIRYSNLNRPEDALKASEEAVEINRALTKDRPDVFRPDFARSLNNLGIRYSELNRHEDGLKASEEAVEINRALAKDRPDVFRPDLAGTLSNLGLRYSILNRHEDALKASEEAVEINRALANDRPDVFRPDLARSLNNLGGGYSYLNRGEDALKASKEAVEIYRALAKDRPDVFRPDLARSLNTLGATLSNLDHREDALEASEEAVEITRELAKDRPDVFRPDLASSLNNLGMMLSNFDRREHALKASEEAVEITRELAKDRPDVFRPDLASRLSVMSDALVAMERNGKAAAIAEEALATLAPYVERHPEVHAGLARTIALDVLRYSKAGGVAPDVALLRRVAQALDTGDIVAHVSGRPTPTAADSVPICVDPASKTETP